MLARPELRRDTKDCVDELALRYRITFCDPANLTFADCIHRLVAFDGSTYAFHRSEFEVRCDPLLDEPMVLLDEVVQIRRRSATTAATEFSGLLQLGDRAGVGRMPVHVDRPWPRAGAG